MSKIRHQWGEAEKLSVTEQQVCVKCGLVRFKWLGIWLYSKERMTEKNLFVDSFDENPGCMSDDFKKPIDEFLRRNKNNPQL